MSGLLVRKYAGALAEVAVELGNQEKVSADLAGFKQLFEGNDELRTVLENPAIAQSAKRKITAEIGTRAGMAKEVANFLSLLLQNNRIELFSEIVPAFEKALSEQLGIVTGEVFTAVPLRDDQRLVVENRLAAITGKTVKLDFHVDDALIGGLKICLGSVIYDVTIKKQLEEIRKRVI